MEKIIELYRSAYAYIRPTGAVRYDFEPYSLDGLTNRGQKRFVMKVARNINVKIASLLNSFYNDLFYGELDYNKAYSKYLSEYIDIYERYCDEIKMDSHWFVKMFKPIEN